MNERIRELAERSGIKVAIVLRVCGTDLTEWQQEHLAQLDKFAESIVRECIDKIETHQIPVGNSAAGEMACEWTYDALKEIRNEIKQHFGVDE
jgi:hypothetical protein